MLISRYLNEASIKIEMNTVIEPLPEECVSIDKCRQHNKEIVLEELVKLLVTGNHFGNFSKLLIDFVNRERKLQPVSATASLFLIFAPCRPNSL